MLGHACLQFRLGKPIGKIISVLVLQLYTSSVSTTETVMGPHRHVALKEGHGGHANIMSCRTQLNMSIAMYFQSPESKRAYEMYDRYELINGYKKMFNVTHGSTLPRNFTLSTNKVEKKHAGEYTCYDNEGIGALLTTTLLTVVDSKPHCKNSREEETSLFMISCRFSFVGTVSELDFQWVKNDIDGPTNLPGGDIEISKNSVISTITVRDEDSSLDKHFTFIVLRRECKHPTCFLYQTPVVLPGVRDRISSFQTTEVNADDFASRKWIVVIVVSAVGLILVIAACITIAILVFRCRKRQNTEAINPAESEIKKHNPFDEYPTQLTVTSVVSLNDQQSTVTSIRSVNDTQSTVSSIRPLIKPKESTVRKKSRFRVSTNQSDKNIKQNVRSAPPMPRIDSCSDNMDTM